MSSISFYGAGAEECSLGWLDEGPFLFSFKISYKQK
jgi:hypothetical protein